MNIYSKCLARISSRTATSICLVIVSICAATLPQHLFAVGHWVPLSNKPPKPSGFKGLGVKLLLPDGTVMVQTCTDSVACGNTWVRLTPDSHGSYQHGTWSKMPSMHYERTDYSSLIMPDGRVFIIGGEYTNNIGGGQGEIYDPSNNAWSLAAKIPSKLFGSANEFDDSQSVTLANGTLLFAPVRADYPYQTLIYNPASNSWSGGGKFQPGREQDEASWVKLPDNSIISPDNNSLNSERYIPATNQWVNAATIPSSMNLYSQSEMGAGLLLPNGRAVFFGGTGHVAYYSLPSEGHPLGSWSAGPDIPMHRVTSDAPAVMMPNGKILVAVGSTSEDGGSPAPTWFYEFDYSAGSDGAFTATSSPESSTTGSSEGTAAGDITFLALPDGTILSSDGADPSGQAYVYVPDGSPLADGQPSVIAIAPNSDGNYHLTGTLLDGISAGAAFGDDAQMDTDYPIVRLTSSTGVVSYARTYKWSSTSVQTGSEQMTTEFVLPPSIALANPGGQAYTLQVVANGIASAPVSFTAPLHFNTEQWFGAWGSDGPIFTGDLNGDGKTDVFMWRDSDKSWTVNLSTGSGFVAERWLGGWGSDGPIITGDFNGDGKTDVMMWRDSDKSWVVNLSTGSGFVTEQWFGAWGSDGPIFTGDLNGDGKTDVFMWRDIDKSWTINLSTGSGFVDGDWVGAWGSDGPIFTGDLNGDGKTDVFMWRDIDKSWTINLSTGSGFVDGDWTGAWGSDGPIFTGDLNGDGKTDVFMWRAADNSWTVNLSTGAGFAAQDWVGNWGSDGPIFTGDLNGDHKTDVFMWRPAFKDWTVNLSTGEGFEPQVWNGSWGSDGPIFTGDFNGDGKTDVIVWRDSDKSWLVNLAP
jgi:hypothetical protein